jgi:hypothetical protein
MRAGLVFLRLSVIAVGIVPVIGCTGRPEPSDGGVRVAPDSVLTRLPVLAVQDGRLICTALGDDPCPLRAAFANRLGNGSYALWEPGRGVLVVDEKNPNGRTLGRIGTGAGQHAVALGVGPDGSDIIVLDGQRSRILRYNASGDFVREDELPRPDPNAAPGFVGRLPVVQVVQAVDSGPVRLRVHVLAKPGEAAGRMVLDEIVPWLRLRDGLAYGATPLFGASARYAIDDDETLVWTPGDRFQVQRRRFDGTVLWTLTSDLKGPPVTPRDIELRRKEVESSGAAEINEPGRLDSMVAITPPTHPAVAGILLQPGGRILVAGASTPSGDFVDYLVLTRDGEPTHRLHLPKETRPLLFDGDSLLVHRPIGEPREVRWLTLGTAR